MTNVINEIRQWATTLPYWEQAALDKIAAGVQFTESEYDELLQYLLEDAGLAVPVSQRPQLKFSNGASTTLQFPSGQMRLEKISNIQNVNALVPKQTITFCPALTTIFGATGAGKSGYARILGCAGFTRGDKEVLPDIAKQWSADTVLSADIELYNGTSSETINYEIGTQCPELATFYVFDSTSVLVHLTKSNMFSFSPAGLSYLTQLADVTDRVRERLKTRVEECLQPHDFELLFQGKSEVAKMISNLGPDTSIEKLKQMATLTLDEKKRIAELDTEIAKLKAEDIPTKINDLEDLIKRLREVEMKLGNDAISDIEKAVELYIEKESLAKNISIDQFESKYFTQIGSDVWHRFIETAKELAEAEQTPNKPYPQDGDHCLLCQHPLSSEERDLLRRLWAFLEGEAQIKLDEAKNILKEKRNELATIDLNFFDEQLVSYRHLQQHNMDLIGQVKTFIEACCQRRDIAIKIIDSYVKETVPRIPSSGISNIYEIIEPLKAQQKVAGDASPSQEIAELQQQLLNLQHREVLSQHLTKIETYVQNRIFAHRAANIGKSTAHITRKYTDLFEELVTERYIQLFEQTLKKLQRLLKVKIMTTGSKGKTRKQIVLETDATASTEKVLSEGEKRAVALADFLTEVALDTHSCGIILDDPVTSLDLEWKDVFASILASEAKCRQVIVFTHDLPFLYFLKKYSEKEQVEIVTHWVKRGDDDDKPGYVYLNNSPALERDYRKPTRAHEIYAQAKTAPPEKQEDLLKEGFAALRTTYEAFIVFDLFSGVISRFDERLSLGPLRGIKWDEKIANEVVDTYERVSRYIEGHLHSDTFISQKPTPAALLSEIEAFNAIKARWKAL